MGRSVTDRRPLVALDSMIAIYLLERHPSYRPKVKPLFASIREGQFRGLLASIGLIEILTGPKELGRRTLAAEYKRRLTTFPHLAIGELTDPVIDLASDLRAKYGLRTPDAIHVATAIASRASRFVTNDQSLQRVTEIEVVTLNEIA